MTRIKTIAANAAWLSSARILNPLTSVLLVSAIARVEGAAALGGYSLVLTFFFMTSSLAALGLATPITRMTATDLGKTAEIINGSMFLALITSAIAAATMIGLINILDYPAQVVDSATILMWAVYPSVAILHLDAVFMGHQRARIIALVSVAENVVKVVIAVALLMTDHDIIAIFKTIAILRFLVFFFYIFYCAKFVAPFRAKLETGAIRRLLASSPVFTTNLLLTTIFGRLDILLLSTLGTLTDVGYYSAAQRLIDIARLLPFSVKRASLSPLSRLFQESAAGFKDLFDRLLAFVMSFGYLGVLMAFVLAGLAIDLIYGDKLAPAAPTLQIMSAYILFTSLTSILGCALFASHNEKLDLVANILKLIAQAILCIALIPSYGVTGAAIAYVSGEFILFVMMYFLVNRRIQKIEALKIMLFPTIAAIVAAVVLMATYELNAILRATLIGLTFLITLMGLDRRLRHDATLVLNKLRKRSRT